MTQDLYRQEALDNRNKSLYGEVVLTSPPKTWLITFILVLVTGIIGGLLFFGNVQTEDGPVSILRWLVTRSG